MMRSIGEFMGIATAGAMALTWVTLAGAAPLGSAVVTLDGEAGLAKKFSGLAMEADIVHDDLSPAPLRALLGANMGSAWSGWLAATAAQGFVQRDLVTVAAFDPQRELEFMNAVITEVTIPKLDGSSKDAAYFDIEISPEHVSSTIGPASALSGAPARAWHTANFEFEIAGLPCDHISAIDSFTWRQEFVRDPQGNFINPANVGDSMKPTTLRITLDAADAPAWSAWQQQFAQSKLTRSGSLRIYAADMQSYATLELKNVGVVAVKPAALEANSKQVTRFDVELHVEKMQFELEHTAVN